MAGHQYYYENYPANGGNGNANMNGNSNYRNRPFTVEEAIPQSPFSSILPYDTDTIPLPQIGLRASTTLYSTQRDSDIARQTIQNLDREAAQPHSTSRRLQETLHELQQLLKPENLTEYKFDPIPTLDPTDPSFNNYVPEPVMNTFSQMLFDNTNVAFTSYAPPVSPAPRNANGYKNEASLHSRSTPKMKSKGISSPQVKTTPKLKTKPVETPIEQPRVEQPREPEMNTINPALLYNPSPVINPALLQKSPIQPETIELQTISPALLQKSLEIKPLEFESQDVKPQDIRSEDNKPQNTKAKDIIPQDIKPQEIKTQEQKPREEKSQGVKPKPVQTPILPPVKKSSKTPQANNAKPKSKHSEQPILPPVKANHNAHLQNSQIEVKALTPKPKVSPRPKTPPKVTPILPQTNDSKTNIEIIIPNLPPSVKREDYKSYPDPPTPPKTTVKQRKPSEGIADQVLSSRPDQRERAEAAGRRLQDFLQELFNTQDSFDNNSVSPNLIMTNEGEATLSAAAQIKVESFVHATITSGSFSQIAIDDLIRLQKLCESGLRPAESLNVKIEETWSEGDLQPWLDSLTSADLSLKAARTALRMMTGGRDDRQIYSEEIIQMSLEGLKNVMEGCMIPIVELRNSGTSASLFKLLSTQKKSITGLLIQCRRLLSLLAELVSSLELSDTVINTLEFISSRLIFVENAHTEKESVLGTQKFDSVRLVAMDVLSQIFLKYPAQRSGIINDILTSLEKLPVARQSARQFKLVEGGSIQLVSALIMKLVQTSANRSDGSVNQRRGGALNTSDDDADGDVDEPILAQHNGYSQRLDSSDTERSSGIHHSGAISSLETISSQLRGDAKNSATIVVTFIIERAQRSTKTGDTPFRNLLDLFIEDFITCLSSPDWPAAELLLRFFAFKMVNLAEADKTPAPAKNMALDSLGVMGAAISELNSHVRKTALALENRDVGQGSQFALLADAILDGKDRTEDIVRWDGPFRATLEFLLERDSADKLVHGAMGYITAEWAAQLCARYERVVDDDVESGNTLQDFGRVAYRLRMMITEKNWLSAELASRHVEPAHARLAFATTLLNSEFCRAFDRVLMILLNAMSSDQASVRSKSLRTVNQVLETDPSILDRSATILRTILRCSDDPSTQVRDAALGLIGKCIGLKPALEEEMIPGILQRFLDTAIGVRKRAIRLSKDIYLRNHNKMVRSSIADALLHRVIDLDESVQELARQTIEEVWISPFYRPASATEEVSLQTQLAMGDMVSLMIRTGQRPGVSAVMEKVLQSILSTDSKTATANFRVCKSLVTTMFDTIIDNPNGENGNGSGARDALQLLMIFAKANPKLFTADQVQLLQPYITNLGNDDDMAVYHSVIVIFRHVLPQLSKVHHGFLVDIRGKLIPAMSRLKRALLDDVVACLWIISVTLNSFDHLSRFTLSVLKGIDQFKKVKMTEDSDHVRKLVKLLLLCGMCGKNCDFDSQLTAFKTGFPAWKGSSVSKLMVDVFSPYTSPTQPQAVRRAALDAIGLVCPSWPKNFSQVNIYTAFQIVFEERTPVLEAVILRSFKEFLLQEEKRSEASGEAAASAPGNGEAPTALAVMGGSHGDGVAIAIAQRFMDDIVRIAMATQDEHALLATEVIASINRQGLVHPTECAHVLVALETSQNQKIAEIAFHEHRALHEKHETLLEKKYMKGVQSAFAYQRDIVKDVRGLLVDPYTAKLHPLIEVFKISKPKSRKRFLERLCEAVDFDPQKLDVKQEIPDHLGLSRFIVENVAFINYVSTEELLATITSMEKVVSSTGTSIAQSIEEEIFNIRVTQSQADGDAIMVDDQIPHVPDPVKLRRYTIYSMILSALWETRTYLRRAYGLLPNRDPTKKVKKDKDVSKAPTKVQGVNGDPFVEAVSNIMNALSSHETMMGQCKAFVDLMTIDSDVKIAAEDEDDAKRFETPSDNEEDTPGPSGSGRGRKRKSSNTPGGRKKRARSGSRARTVTEEEDIEWG